MCRVPIGIGLEWSMNEAATNVQVPAHCHNMHVTSMCSR